MPNDSTTTDRTWSAGVSSATKTARVGVPGSPVRFSEPTEPRREVPLGLGADQDDVFTDYVRARGGGP